MQKIGITGGIASGKSVLTEYLISQGAYVIDADLISRKVVEPNTRGAELIRESFGEEFFDADGNLKRKALAQEVFASPFKLAVLNSLIHPLIRNEIAEMLSKSRRSRVFVILPLLFEARMRDLVDVVWTVSAPEEMRIKWLTERDNITVEEAYNRIRSQLSDEEREAGSDAVFYNDGSVADFVNKVAKEYHKLRHAKRKNNTG